MSNDAIDFTREDADRITRMEQMMITLDEKIDKLTISISVCQTNCGTRRADVNKRVKELEDKHLEETGTLKGRKSDFALTLSLFSLFATALSIYVVYVTVINPS